MIWSDLKIYLFNIVVDILISWGLHDGSLWQDKRPVCVFFLFFNFCNFQAHQQKKGPDKINFVWKYKQVLFHTLSENPPWSQKTKISLTLYMLYFPEKLIIISSGISWFSAFVQMAMKIGLEG